MKSFKKYISFLKILAIATMLCPIAVGAQVRTEPLNGTWKFMLDPMKTGEHSKWPEQNFADSSLDKVNLPHSYSADPRYFYYTGTAWYFKTFENKIPAADYRAILHFDAVFYKSKIWVNGNFAGAHEGGYTPFDIDITNWLRPGKNQLSVQVNNEWDSTTIPGAKTFVNNRNADMAQLYPWINYGGITRPVEIRYQSAAYISSIKLSATPNLQKHTAQVEARVRLYNASHTPVNKQLGLMLYYKGKPVIAKPILKKITLSPSATIETVLTIPLAKQALHLWNITDPQLYDAMLFADEDTVRDHLGIRKIEIRGARLLLNGEEIKLGGANRPTDYPGLGSVEPDSIIENDLRLMKQGGMIFSRIAHHAVSKKVLDWADRNGMLIITEAGNWQMTPAQMADTAMRRNYRLQLTEMVVRDWNHPSVIAYSLGNEFHSYTKEGINWVKDMRLFVRTLDSTRLITFASNMVWRDFIQKPEDEASNYVDFISTNMYDNYEKHLQHIQKIYPGKPIYVSEFGIRVAAGKKEQDRIAHIKKAITAFRNCKTIIGASIWTFNDYQSRFPGTDDDGYRKWGLVDAHRNPRKLYHYWQEEFSPAMVEVYKENGKIKIKVQARKDFPVAILKNYHLKLGEERIPVKTLAPGDSQEFEVSADADVSYIELLQPQDFVIIRKKIKQ